LNNYSCYWALGADDTSFGPAFYTWCRRGCFCGAFHRFIKIIHHVGEEIAVFPNWPNSLAIRACYHLKITTSLAHTKRPKLVTFRSKISLACIIFSCPNDTCTIIMTDMSKHYSTFTVYWFQIMLKHLGSLFTVMKINLLNQMHLKLYPKSQPSFFLVLTTPKTLLFFLHT
jgi:hypothetical protein